MRLKIYWAALFLLLFSLFTLQFSQAISQDSNTITNYAVILPKGSTFNPSTDVFWEYGAEGGAVKPPWDYAQMFGSGSRDPPSTVRADQTHVRTGNYSTKLHMVPAPRSDAQGRLDCREDLQDDGVTAEFWLSWWVYFDNTMEESGGSGGQYSTCLGGMQAFFGPPGDRFKYFTSWRFHWDSGEGVTGQRKLFVKWWEGKTTGGPYHEYFPSASFYLNSSTENCWIHFQMYIKWSNTTDGIYCAWVNKEGEPPMLVKELTGIQNDPRSFDVWTPNTDFSSEGITVLIEFYDHKLGASYAQQYWYDDVVVSSTRVGETYGVGGQA